MGWGTFIAGYMISSARRRRPSDSKEWWDAYGQLCNRYVVSYKRRTIQGTVLIHPEVQNKVDGLEWEIDIQKRAGRDCLTQQVVLAVVSAFWLFSGTLHYGVLLLPLLWYYFKSRLIKASRREINRQFANEGYEVERLLKEIPLIYRAKSEIAKKQAEEELIKYQEDVYKRKFGIE